ncbi:filamin-B [Oncorhynchus kisutch]|uniref:filamin-B n=1 Tax=Oncorhynchus kisutch TaxID=8019 RepID=UPI0012DC3F96|nr:filamin-B-like [Oncorhynchus kisutch]
MPFTKSEVSLAEHSVCAARCNLTDDVPLKNIQKNTITRWCNKHLKCVNRFIGDLQFDLNDGLTLIALLEVLSHKKMFRKYHTRPTFRQMRLDNVSAALEFLEQENVKMMSIDSKAIVDGNMKLILGLVWFLHYSISSHLLEEEGQDKTKKQTPELRLLGGSWTRCPNCLSPTSARTGRMAWLLGHWWTDWPQVCVQTGRAGTRYSK